MEFFLCNFHLWEIGTAAAAAVTYAAQEARVCYKSCCWLYTLIDIIYSCIDFLVYFFGGLECVGYSFAYVAYLWFLREVLILTRSAVVASGRATNLANGHPFPYLAIRPLYLAIHSSSYIDCCCSIRSIYNNYVLLLMLFLCNSFMCSWI